MILDTYLLYPAGQFKYSGSNSNYQGIRNDPRYLVIVPGINSNIPGLIVNDQYPTINEQLGINSNNPEGPIVIPWE